jgi:conjugative relaxase-like TrwC/TraI family protein
VLSIGRITAGAGYEYLTRDVATSRRDYYAGAGEKPGVWWGDGLGRLSLSGQVTEGQMAALYGHALDPATGEPLGRRFPVFRSPEQRLAHAVDTFTADWGRPPNDAELARLEARVDRAPQRDAIAALDLTFSPVKSVSVLWALATDEVRAEVEAAHDAAVEAALTHLQDVAGTTRAGTNGVRTVDSDGWVVARFTHRMSRARDPQLHTHCAILNRVHCSADGRWRTLDSRAIYRLAAGGGGIYTRALEDELTNRLGARWVDIDPDGPTPRRELAGVPRDLARDWSKRRAQVEDALAELDEAPRTAAGRAAASQQATLRTRPAKAHEDRSPHARWRYEARRLGFDADRLVAAIAPGPTPAPGRTVTVDGSGRAAADTATHHPDVDVEDVLDRAVARLEENQATWRRGNLIRAVAEALPASARTADETSALVDRLVAETEGSGRLVAIAAPEPVPVPAELRRRDGTSVYRPAAGTRYTTPGILAAEARIVAAARAVDATLSVPANLVDDVLARGPRPGLGYGPDQAAAVRAICGSGRTFEVLIGPAGAGKTTTMRALAEAWSATGNRVIGLAVAQTAANVLASEAGIPASNISRWLHLAGNRPDDPHLQMLPGDLVVVDEVGMVPTRQLDELRRQAQEAGAKIVGVGDPLQLGPVGAGGAARLVASDVGATYLHEVHRFTHAWEAEATLAIRAGDADAATAYDTRGRLHGGDRDTALAGARAAWLQDHLAGRDTLLLAASVDQVSELAGWCRDQLVAHGHVDNTTTVTLHDGNQAGAGDLVITRRNDRITDVANRDVWHLDAIAPDGALALRHARDGRSTIVDADYASEHVELAYAMTVHAAQGRTADAGHLVVTTGLDRELLYVGMTRGRTENHAWVVSEDFLHSELGGGSLEPADAIRNIVTQEPTAVSATEVLRAELGSADSLQVLGPIHADLAAIVTRRRTLSYIEHRYGSDTADWVASDPASAALVALVRRAPTVGADADRLLAHACGGDLGGADSAARVLAARTHRILDAMESDGPGDDRLDRPPADWEPPAGSIERYYDEMGALMDQRVRSLGEQAASQAPDWALRQWGPVPDHAVARTTWVEAAGEVAAYQERWATTAGPDDLASSPPPRRAVDQWIDYQGLRRWLDLDHNDIADIAQDGPDADRNGIDDRTQTGPDRDANRVLDDVDIAMAELTAVQAALDRRLAPQPGLEPDIDVDAAVAPDVDLGP